MQTYSYEVIATGSSGPPQKVAGTVEAAKGDLVGAAQSAMRSAFEKLTHGNATYGHPGEGGCRGPYTIDQVTLTRWKDQPGEGIQ